MRKAELMNIFLHFCKDMGKTAYISEADLKSVKMWGTEYWVVPCEITHTWQVDAWFLDNATCYGGWVIRSCDNDSGGVDHPLGQSRYKAKDLYNMISFARIAMWIK